MPEVTLRSWAFNAFMFSLFTIELQRRALTLLLERRLVPEPPSRNEVEDIPKL
jgi:hypothetical protein